jgi:hypothetical protein
MSNELTISGNPGAAGAGSATGEGLTTGAERAGASLPAGTGRKAEIERAMREDFDAYESSGMAAEYRQILQDEIEAANPNAGVPTTPLSPDAARAALCSSVEGQRLVYDWSRDGAFPTRLANVQRDIGEIVREAGNALRQRHFMERFSQNVPVAVEVALMDEIATGAPSWVRPASQAEIDLFAVKPAGKALVQFWGDEAPQRVAILRTRALRLVERLDEDAAADLWAWLDGLDNAMVMKIFGKLSNG